MKNTLILIFSIWSFFLFGQIHQPFSTRYSTKQKGNIKFLANVSVFCDLADNACSNAAMDMPVTGTNPQDNNAFTAQYVDVDSDASTFMSSSDSLDLSLSSNILWAGLYWGAKINSSTTGYASRQNIKLSVNNGTYQALTADELVDITSTPSYFCFKDITSIVQSNPQNSKYTVADLISRTGGSNQWGGWSIVFVYQNDNESLRDLSVFDGVANISLFSNPSTPSVSIPLSGFQTPTSGPVNFELGVIAHESDRQQTGDELKFNNVNIFDAIHEQTNIFNATISNNEQLTPNRTPDLNNTLGLDANIYVPDNSNLNYLQNNTTSANVEVSTSAETIIIQVITTSIDDVSSLNYNDFILNGIDIYPNPTSDIITLKGISSLTDVSYIHLLDNKGALLRKIGINETQIDLSSLSTGIYFIEIKHQLGRGRIKVVKQ